MTTNRFSGNTCYYQAFSDVLDDDGPSPHHGVLADSDMLSHHRSGTDVGSVPNPDAAAKDRRRGHVNEIVDLAIMFDHTTGVNDGGSSDADPRIDNGSLHDAGCVADQYSPRNECAGVHQGRKVESDIIETTFYLDAVIRYAKRSNAKKCMTNAIFEERASKVVRPENWYAIECCVQSCTVPIKQASQVPSTVLTN